MTGEQKNQTIDQLVFFLFQKYMKDAFKVNYTINLIRIFFSKYQGGYRKGFSTQHTLLVMIGKITTARDNTEFCTAILTSLSRAFDCICHDLLIAKLNPYGFDRNALKPIYDCFSDRS